MRLPFVAVAAVLAMQAPAHAGGALPEDHGADYRAAPPAHDIVITSQDVRSRKTIVVIAAIAGVALIAGGLGVYENLDSKSAADAVSASAPTLRPWSPADQANVDRASSSGTKAEIFYGIGGAALIGAIVALIVTDPKTETTVIHPHVTPTVAPAPGAGAMLGGTWRF